ncbi:hypothetical protein FB567DRAFT_518293 [Paraphoma chrysanthemicola]|uniref:Uncharacterized protein n=1 Tax=Paraphoma chrysanthemicola TaxID=798071 RepID=A0A8K0RCA5_9PLEO|nr:hypothetical protein FB567DRAFT_518293 [Paraphoma chrysanthemicola]
MVKSRERTAFVLTEDLSLRKLFAFLLHLQHPLFPQQSSLQKFSKSATATSTSMSDNEETKGKGKKVSGVQSWSEHELLVYLLSAIEYTGQKIDFANAPAPVGRNSNGCAQKMAKVKKTLQPEIDAIKNGQVIEGSGDAAPAAKKAGGRKRKVKDDDDGAAENEGAKKRGRAKKKAESEPEPKEEPVVKDEPEAEADIDTEV